MTYFYNTDFGQKLETGSCRNKKTGIFGPCKKIGDKIYGFKNKSGKVTSITEGRVAYLYDYKVKLSNGNIEIVRAENYGTGKLYAPTGAKNAKGRPVVELGIIVGCA